MASLTNIDVPGAYPATPSNEEPTFQTQHHNSFAGPGMHVDETSLAHSADAPTLSHENHTQQAQFNQATPRGLGNEAKSKGQLSGDSGAWADDSPSTRERGTEEPGSMTGAYSRIGTQDSAFTQGSDYTYGDKSASQPPFDRDTRRLNPAMDLAAKTPASALAGTTAPNSINKTSANRYVDDHNKIQSGLRGSSKTANNEPYWGDIPFGAGVYNGVTGHGSNESTSHQRSLHDQYNTATNSGIYNGVTGHGSKQSPRYDEATTTADSSHQRRAFPLANNGSTTATTTKPNDADEHKRDSRFKEGLAGTGATAVGGFVARDHFSKENDGRAKATDERLTGERSNILGQSKPDDALAQPRGYKGEEAVNKYEEQKQSLPHRPFVAAPVQNHTQERTLDRQPLDTENDSKHQKKEDSNRGKYGAATGAGAYGVNKYTNRDSTKEHSSAPEDKVSRGTAREPARSDVQPLDTKTEHRYKQKEDSNLGKYGAAAAAAGAGAYGVNKYANRDSTKEQSSVPETKASHGTVRESAQNDAQVVSDNNRIQPHYNILSDGAPSGVASTSVHQPDNGSRSGASQSERYSVPSDGNATGETQSAGRSSSDSSHGGKYNVLASGTPSGINLEQARAEKQHRREQQQHMMI
ncbi:hypothetical protein F5B21DRAFT_459067 [Xylaria acuta]|nr:hypothetical protein F5B21DRAFT_459067 [Xylaria acuta]